MLRIEDVPDDLVCAVYGLVVILLLDELGRWRGIATSCFLAFVSDNCGDGSETGWEVDSIQQPSVLLKLVSGVDAIVIKL